MARSLLCFLLRHGGNAPPGARPGIVKFEVFTRTRVLLPLRPRVHLVVASMHPPSSGFQLAQGSPVSVQMVLDLLIGPQGNTYVDGVPTDDLMWELDRRADLVYAEVVEERNQEEMARYADSGLESD